MQSVFIIILFLVVKTFQWLNSFILARLFGADEGSTIMISMLIFISVLFVFGLLAKKFFPKALGVAWMVIVLFLIISSLISPLWAIIFLASLFLYALIGTEAQVLRSLSSYKHIPQLVLFLLSLLPIVISYQIPQLQVVAPQLFYIVSSVLAFFASYSARTYGGGKFTTYQKAPSIWLGLLFIAGSILLSYLGFYKATGALPDMFLALILLFYAAGALMVYMSIDERLRKTRKLQ